MLFTNILQEKGYNFMKEGRDFALIYHVNKHYEDLKHDSMDVDSFSSFLKDEKRRRAILFDFLQIGELLNRLSKQFKDSFSNKNLYDIIAIRNRIVHGYETLINLEIYTIISEELSPFIDRLNNFAHEKYREKLAQLLGKNVYLRVFHPKGFTAEGTTYPINWGQIENLTALDGSFQDAYLIDGDDPIKEVPAKVIAIIEREDDIEDQLAVSIKDAPISDEEIEQAVRFKEKDHKYRIVRKQ